MTDALQNIVDSLRISLAETADTQGVGKDFRAATAIERGAERRALLAQNIRIKIESG